jgi:hypothetical protein
LLEVPGRRLPVIVELIDGGKPLTSVAGADLVGLAHIFQVTGSGAVSRFINGFGYSLLDPGTIMVVWPGRHEPEVLRIRELPQTSVRAEWQRLVAQVAGSAARSVAAPRVPPTTVTTTVTTQSATPCAGRTATRPSTSSTSSRR